MQNKRRNLVHPKDKLALSREILTGSWGQGNIGSPDKQNVQPRSVKIHQAIADYVMRENHIIDWDGADRFKGWIKEALAIR